MNELYDVILVGIHAESTERSEVINAIAELLEVDAAKLKHIVDSNLKAIVKQGVVLEDAQNYQHHIQRRGGFCNYRPSQHSGVEFELAPMDPGNLELPVECIKCNVVPSKYKLVSEIQYEHDTVKKRLLSKHHLIGQHEMQLANHEEQKAQRSKLEEEIKHGLGLPKVINSRFRLISAAVILWVLGIFVGVGVRGFFLQKNSLGWDWSASAQEGANQSNSNWSLSPQQEALHQISALVRAGSPSEFESIPVMVSISPMDMEGVNPIVNPLPAKMQTSSTTGAWPSIQWKPVRINGKVLLQEMRTDREWELFLASEAERLAKLRQPAKAYKNLAAISWVPFKIGMLGTLAVHYLETKDRLGAENVLNMAMNSIESLPDMADRVDNLGWLATILWRLGEKGKAQQYLLTAEKLIADMTEPTEKSKGLANLATRQAQIGHMKQAEGNFRQANQIILSISNLEAKLRAYIHLAYCYSQSGNNAIPAAIILKTLNTVNRIKDRNEQQNLIGEIATSFVDIGDIDYALATLDRLNPQLRERMLFNITRELAYTNRPFEAMKALDKLANPEYQSRAAALLSMVFHFRPGMKSLSSTYLQNAIAIQGEIANPQDQAVVRGEMARYLAHSGFNKEADEWAAKALESARSIKTGQERDIAYAFLAVNFARSKQSNLASETLAQIKDAELSENANREIASINQIFSEP